jgi:hypothetical protein
VTLQVPGFIPLFGGCEPLGGGAPGYQIAYGVTVECATPHGPPRPMPATQPRHIATQPHGRPTVRPAARRACHAS